MNNRDLIPTSALYAALALVADTVCAAEPVPSTVSVLGLLMPVILVLLIGAISLWLVRRRFSGALLPAGPLKVLQIIPVGPRERVMLIDHDGRRWLCGVTAQQISFAALAAGGADSPLNGDPTTKP